MDSETLMLQTNVKGEFWKQDPAQLDAGGDIKVPDITVYGWKETTLRRCGTLGDLIAPVCKTMIPERMMSGGNGQQEGKEQTYDNSNSDPVKLYFNPSDSFMYITNGPAIGIAMSATEDVREVYLKNMFTVPPNHGFYCPKCKVCIDKVLYCTTQKVDKGVPHWDPPISDFPSGPWQPQNIIHTEGPSISGFPSPPPHINGHVLEVPPIGGPTVTGDDGVVQGDHQGTECLVRCSTCFSFVVQKGKEFITRLVSCGPSESPDSGSVQIIIPVPDPGAVATTSPQPGSSKGWEILKSIVYGGLAELLASLSVVTSAASADSTTFTALLAAQQSKDETHRQSLRCSPPVAATRAARCQSLKLAISRRVARRSPPVVALAASRRTVIASCVERPNSPPVSAANLRRLSPPEIVSIITLSIANLIGGLSVLGHHLRDLKSSKTREQGSEETSTQDDKYYELLGDRNNFYLHAFFAILSFTIFGLVPPIAYGFSFRESNDKDLKLAAVAIASLICITLLAIAKAHIQKPNNTYKTYFKTVAFYVTSGVLASLLTYEAGAMVNKLVKQLGWFEPKSKFGLALSGVSVENFGLGSY
ncbi:hypothetical protein VNO78_24326 [Psophocarpus tetragonolobus]|uniref:Membrane protein of ER body-like protein n=1 Tax=Psophocarpus tetragonolobus TaxID=3891 RepID=A0AAN9S4I3_PSOTE